MFRKVSAPASQSPTRVRGLTGMAFWWEYDGTLNKWVKYVPPGPTGNRSRATSSLFKQCQLWDPKPCGDHGRSPKPRESNRRKQCHPHRCGALPSCHTTIPKGPCTQIVDTLGPMYLYREYLRRPKYILFGYMDP